MWIERARRAALPVVAVVALIVVVVAASISSANAGTLGYDYGAYDAAVRRVLAGGVLYDASPEFMGARGLFFYPPPFILLALPFTLLDPGIVVWAWTAGLVAAFAASVALMPIGGRIKWLVLLLGALSWPLIFAIKLGQVGPILLLTFAIAWRWMDRPWRFGTAAAIGTAIKLQPALLLGWALVTGRRRALVTGVAVLGVLALLATLIAGPAAWGDQAALLARVSLPIDTPHNYTPGRLAFEAGLGSDIAWGIQLLNWALVIVVVLVALVRCSAVGSYLAVVIATQLASPILWDHYALILLLPVAWLLSRGRRWAVVIPLATSVILVGVIPPLTYPLVFWGSMLAVVREGWVTA